MANPITLFRASLGLNTKVDPNRIRFDPETGVQDLAVAYNIDHDRTGRIGRRKGFSATDRIEDIHSMWCDKGECLFAMGTSLCVMAPDYSYTAVATVTAGAKIGYVQVAQRAFWVNGHEKGVVENSENSSWDKGTYVGPDTHRQFSGPPIGNLLAYRAGRMWISEGPIIWFSEPYSLNLFDLTRGFMPLEHNVTMMQFVRDGAFVGTEQSILFFQGSNPEDVTPIKLADYGVIRGTDISVDGEEIGEGNLTGKSVIWTSPAGVCVGFPDGTMINVTRNRISYPSSMQGAGLVIEDRYIGLLEP
jgi:hypothetical protein